MTTRRKFLFNGSLAATALLAAKPFTSLANSISPVTGYRINNYNLVLAHTGNATAGAGNTPGQIAKLKSDHPNLLMLHAGDNEPATQLAYDASIHSGTGNSVAANDYKIIYKGDIKTGVITAGEHSASIESINTLAAYLKKEKNCHLVVCLSQLGYRTANGINDLQLAALSTHLDIIVGGHADNFCTRSVIARNKNKEEVIINYAANNSLALRKIEIGFDNRGRKSQVAFTRSC